ncbi:MAG: nicotinate-nucleotide adenylyltransferase [Chitinophagales bacterium]|nr:nicotinate-nucleotide adenylyltransferase [Chitinophagales bacterium]
MKIVLLFGSFNPIHIGHLLIATKVKEAIKADEVWLIVSPHNPHKNKTDLANETHRLQMAQLATENHPFIKVSDIEFQLSQPSYTYNTLVALQAKFPNNEFHLIIGGDNVAKFDTWKNYEAIIEKVPIHVFKRGNEIIENKLNFNILDLGLLDISATAIRQRIQQNLVIRYFVTENVEQYIAFHKLYQ